MEQAELLGYDTKSISFHWLQPISNTLPSMVDPAVPAERMLAETQVLCRGFTAGGLLSEPLESRAGLRTAPASMPPSLMPLSPPIRSPAGLLPTLPTTPWASGDDVRAGVSTPETPTADPTLSVQTASSPAICSCGGGMPPRLRPMPHRRLRSARRVFSDADVSAVTSEEELEEQQNLLQRILSDTTLRNRELTVSCLESVLERVQNLPEQLRDVAARMFLHNGWYFTALRSVSRAPKLFTALLTDTVQILSAMCPGQPLGEWPPVDKVLMLKELKDYSIIQTFRQIRKQISQLLGPDGFSMLSSMEHELLLAIVHDFLRAASSDYNPELSCPREMPGATLYLDVQSERVQRPRLKPRAPELPDSPLNPASRRRAASARRSRSPAKAAGRAAKLQKPRQRAGGKEKAKQRSGGPQATGSRVQAGAEQQGQPDASTLAEQATVSEVAPAAAAAAALDQEEQPSPDPSAVLDATMALPARSEAEERLLKGLSSGASTPGRSKSVVFEDEVIRAAPEAAGAAPLEAPETLAEPSLWLHGGQKDAVLDDAAPEFEDAVEEQLPGPDVDSDVLAAAAVEVSEEEEMSGGGAAAGESAVPAGEEEAVEQLPEAAAAKVEAQILFELGMGAEVRAEAGKASESLHSEMEGLAEPQQAAPQASGEASAASPAQVEAEGDEVPAPADFTAPTAELETPPAAGHDDTLTGDAAATMSVEEAARNADAEREAAIGVSGVPNQEEAPASASLDDADPQQPDLRRPWPEGAPQTDIGEAVSAPPGAEAPADMAVHSMDAAAADTSSPRDQQTADSDSAKAAAPRGSRGWLEAGREEGKGIAERQKTADVEEKGRPAESVETCLAPPQPDQPREAAKDDMQGVVDDSLKDSVASGVAVGMGESASPDGGQAAASSACGAEAQMARHEDVAAGGARTSDGGACEGPASAEHVPHEAEQAEETNASGQDEPVQTEPGLASTALLEGTAAAEVEFTAAAEGSPQDDTGVTASDQGSPGQPERDVENTAQSAAVPSEAAGQQAADEAAASPQQCVDASPAAPAAAETACFDESAKSVHEAHATAQVSTSAEEGAPATSEQEASPVETPAAQGTTPAGHEPSQSVPEAEPSPSVVEAESGPYEVEAESAPSAPQAGTVALAPQAEPDPAAAQAEPEAPASEGETMSPILQAETVPSASPVELDPPASQAEYLPPASPVESDPPAAQAEPVTSTVQAEPDPPTSQTEPAPSVSQEEPDPPASQAEPVASASQAEADPTASQAVSDPTASQAEAESRADETEATPTGAGDAEGQGREPAAQQEAKGDAAAAGEEAAPVDVAEDMQPAAGAQGGPATGSAMTEAAGAATEGTAGAAALEPESAGVDGAAARLEGAAESSAAAAGGGMPEAMVDEKEADADAAADADADAQEAAPAEQQAGTPRGSTGGVARPPSAGAGPARILSAGRVRVSRSLEAVEADERRLSEAAQAVDASAAAAAAARASEELLDEVSHMREEVRQKEQDLIAAVSDEGLQAELKKTLSNMRAELTKSHAAIMQASRPSATSDASHVSPLVDGAGGGADAAAVPAGLKPAVGLSEPPTEEEVQEYAQYLGMDLQEDSDLLFVAEWALQAEVPAGWTVHLDPESNEFFYHAAKGISQYEHPMDEKYRAYYQELRAKKRARAASGGQPVPGAAAA